MSTEPNTSAPPIAPANADQARAWDGDEGAHWAANAERYARASAGYLQPLLTAASLRPQDDVLDVGCGSGATTLAAGRAASEGTALGLDLSRAMLDVARAQAAREGSDNVRFEQGDAQVHPFAADAFDVVLSRFGVMFFADHAAAFRNLARAARPDGRLAVLAWQSLPSNEWLREIQGALAAGRELPAPGAGTPTPFGLSEPDFTRPMLESAGWRGVACHGVESEIRLGEDPEDALAFLRGTGAVVGMLGDLSPEAREAALDRLLERLAAHASSDGVVFAGAAWLITATRA